MSLRYMCIGGSVASQTGTWTTDSGTIIDALAAVDSNLVKADFAAGTYIIRIDIDTAHISFDTVNDSSLPLHWDGDFDITRGYIGQNAGGAVYAQCVQYLGNYYVCIYAGVSVGVLPTNTLYWRQLTTVTSAGLPPGFEPLSETIYVDDMVFNGRTLFLQFDALTESGGFSTGGLHTFNYPWVSTRTMLDVINDGFGFRSVTGGVRWDNSAIYGTYDLNSWTITSVLPNPSSQGDLVTITGTNLQNIPLVPPLTLHYTDANGTVESVTITDATLVDNQHITFHIPPPTLPVISKPPFYDGTTVTIFSGIITLGNIIIYNATGSGIYRIVKDKRNDTLYNRAISGGTTDVAIPEPFAETGFIGG